MNTIKIFLRTDHLNLDGTHAVCVRLLSKRRKKDISLRIYVKAKDWQFDRNLVKRSDPTSDRKNKLIKKFKNKAENIVDEYFFENKTLTFDDFEKRLLNKEYSDDSFYEFVLEKVEGKTLSHETKRHYVSQITKLQQFKKKLMFSEINNSFIQNYKNYMLKNLKNSPNTANKCLKKLKTFVNWAVEEKLMKENPFENLKFTQDRVNREYINLSELNILEDLYYQDSLSAKQKNVLQYFLFVCYTGLRYTDIKNLKHKDLKKRFIDKIETKFINIEMHKTGLEVSIPIIMKAIKLMPKKYTANQKVFRVLSNQKTNQYLKEIMKIAKIDKNITFHCARHTLATTGLEMGIPIEVISKILGHTEIKMTQIYAKVNDNLKYKEMLKLDKKSDENAA